jgi:hypothetical protein
MSQIFQSHGGKSEQTTAPSGAALAAAQPAPGDISADEQGDFGYLVPPLDAPDNYLPVDAGTVDELDELGNLMIDQSLGNNVDATADSSLPPVLTYWGQFLDHELTARTDRDSLVTSIKDPHPPNAPSTIEVQLKNARTPRFDLDSVYGGVPLGTGVSSDVATLMFGMRHPVEQDKMRVGTAHGAGPLPDGLDPHRDLPRYGQVQAEVREAALRLAEASMPPEDFQKFRDNLDGRALIGDMRNDENLIVAQFHLSFLRFHNRVVDFLNANNTGWIADYHSAKTLTRLHYQWLIIEGYLKQVCDPDVVDRILDDRASHFFKFRAECDDRQQQRRLGNALPLEFSVAAYRFGHTMVRNVYDYNSNFGRPGNGILPNAPFDEIFAFTGGGGFRGLPRVPENWVIDWSRFVGTNPHDSSDGEPARVARRIDTELAPPLGSMVNEANDEPDLAVKELFKHLARRNLRRGYNLKLPTGQAAHSYLKQHGAVNSDPITDVGSLFDAKPGLQSFLRNSNSRLHERTPLWFYCLAEAENAGGNRLGELGSWIVASTFIGVLLSDPESALTKGFTPDQSPLRMPDGTPIDTIAKWMKFALVME